MRTTIEDLRRELSDMLIDVEQDLGPEAVDDPAVVFDLVWNIAMNSDAPLVVLNEFCLTELGMDLDEVEAG